MGSLIIKVLLIVNDTRLGLHLLSRLILIQVVRDANDAHVAI